MTCNPTYSTDESYVGSEKNKCLTTELLAMQADIAAMQNTGTVEPIAIATMVSGKIDNITGGQYPDPDRICSTLIPIQSGKSYWQVNDLGYQMFVILYDEDEMFKAYYGKADSGQKMDITTAGAVYMRLSSKAGEKDLTNEFRIYDADPASAPDTGNGLTKAEADTYYAPISHTHPEYVASANDILTKLLTVDGENSGLDADLLDGRSSADFAAAAHTHNLTNLDGALPISKGGTGSTNAATALSALGAAPATHSHTAASIGAAAASHNHDGAYSPTNHGHTPASIGAADSNHGHTPASIGAAAASHNHDGAYSPTSHNHDNSYSRTYHSHYYLMDTDYVYCENEDGNTVVTLCAAYKFDYRNGKPMMYMSTRKPMFFAGAYITGEDFVFDGDMLLGGDIYGSPSIIKSSDAREKHDIKDLDTKYEDLFNLLRVVTYEYNNGRSQRDHVGFIAQEVEQALETAGLTTQEFAGFVKTPVFGEKEVRSIKEVVDEETGEVTQQEVVTTEVDTDVILDEKYSLRYDEFIGICVHMIQKLMKRVDALEARL